MARPGVERLEDRAVPAAHVHLNPQAAPFLHSAPWGHRANRHFVEAQAPAQLKAMYFNTPGTYRLYVDAFHGVVRGWAQQAAAQGITDDAGLMQFLGNQLNEKFRETRSLLVHLYPGQSDRSYRLLMAMNLAHGYYVYASTPGSDRSLQQTLSLPTGDCTEIADLLKVLVNAQGIGARELAQAYDYHTPVGHFVANHVVVYAGGLWLDSEINTAFAVNLKQLRHIPPTDRLPDLLVNHHVFGFYNWYLQPQVRLNQLNHGEDGGIIAFYYQYYFAGIGQGKSQIYFSTGA